MMRRIVTAVACAALMLMLVPADAVSQEEERGQLAYLMQVDVAPADRAAYRSALENLSDAAEAAGITDYSWHFWNNSTGFVLYFPVDNYAYFDDDDQFWAAFEGTAGQAGRDEFFEAIQSIPSQSTSSIIETIPGLQYWPEDFVEINANHVHHEWLAAGASEDEWIENAKGWIAFLEKIDYPFGATAYRTQIGEETMSWVFFVPGLSEFHADENWDDLVEAAGAGEEMEALVADWNSIVRRMEHTSAGYAESMSYDSDDE
jgi:hypothetical protein